MINKCKRELKNIADKEQAINLQRFFKTGKGDYGEGDVFLGLRMGETRSVAKKFIDMSFSQVEQLLHSKEHEFRMAALLILVFKFQRIKNPSLRFASGTRQSGKEELKDIFDLYIKNTKYINNWDLVDATTPQIVGQYLLDKDRKILYKMAKSKDLWEKRISILATYTFIRNNQYEDTLKIADILLNDEHDLIHKAVGWMVREVGNRDRNVEEKFLKTRYKDMPRTMLRYAIEKFPKELYQRYLKGKI